MLYIIGALAVAVLIVMLKFKVNIGWIMLIESGFIAAAAGMSPYNAGSAMLRGVYLPKTLGTIAILFFISMIENIMRRSGLIEDIAANLQRIMKGKLAAAVTMPVVLGMLPSVGGARFSCPMVQEVLKDEVSSEDKAFINYWYRHVWQDSFILYPGIVMAASLTNVSVMNLFAISLIFGVIHFSAGLIWAIPATRRNKANRVFVQINGNFEPKVFIRAIFPILLIILLYFPLSKLMSSFVMESSVLISLIYLIIMNKYSFREIWDIIKKSFRLNYTIITVGVMVFTEVLADSGLMGGVIQGVLRYNIPVAVLFIVLPFAVGTATGLTLTFVSLMYPILIPLGMGSNPWIVALTYLAGFAGVLLSPFHICGIMTSDYFTVRYRDILRRCAVTEVLVFIPVIAILIFILR